ncbi:hypothetical protein GCM10009807_21740 [Microbacterium lacus]|uniref:Uncharacterized protein n=1 Tax=Microbacterium lacus TaxID=415217 RepID=A0ABN2GVD3_9MICO
MGGLEDNAGRRVPGSESTVSPLVRGVIERTLQPHDLPPALHALWRDGFHAGAEKVRSRLLQAEADAARYYYEAYNSDEAKARHRQMLAEFQVALNRKSTAERWAELDRIAASRSAVTR